MSQNEQQADWRTLLEQAGPYPLEAFEFVREGLGYTVEIVHQQHGIHGDADENDRHITGQQLCLGLRDFAIERYGLLAPIVLENWNIRRTEDFGRIVFAMIEAGIMTRTEEDSLEDFRAVYHFREAFSQDELLSRIGVG